MIKNFFERSRNSKSLIYIILLCAIVTLTYSNHFQNSFHFDDSHTIENNLFIQDIKNIPLFFKDGTTFSSLPQNQSYRPVVSTSLALDYRMGRGYDLFYFHLSTFILFLLQGILMFFFIFKIFDVSYKNTWNFYFAAFATALYLLHPANAETVNYIIARSDLQSTFFLILGLVLYVFSTFCKKTYIYLIPVAIGVLAKPSAVMFAPLLFFYIVLFEYNLSLSSLFKKENLKKLIAAIINVAPAFIFCAIMYKWVDHFTPKTWQSGGASTWNYLITQPFVIVHYFTTFFLPLGLSADTDWEPLQTIWNIKFFIGCTFIFLMIFIAFWFSKSEKLRPVSYGIIWFFLALIPSSSVIPFAEVLNDHRIFFPYVGLVICVTWTAGLLLMNYKKRFGNSPVRYEVLLGITALIMLTGFAYGTRQRNKVWKTEESLWYDVTLKSPKNARGLMNYGLSKMSKGDYKEAENYFLKAINMWPYYSFLHVNMGVLKQATGDKENAEKYFKNAIQYGGNYPDSWYFYGNFLCNQLRYKEAISALTKAIELSPAHVGARSRLMQAYNEVGEWDKLSELAQSTLQIIPGNPEATKYLQASQNRKGKVEVSVEEIKKNPTAERYLDLSLMLYQKGMYMESIGAAAAALKLKPDYAEAYNNIGSAYNQLKQYDKAIAACQKALEINPKYDLAKNNLLAALNGRNNISQLETKVNSNPTAENYLNLSLTYYQQGMYEKSIDACKNAIKLKPDFADAYSNMCAAYNQLKQWDKAIEACNKALVINPSHKLANGNLNWAKDEKAKGK